MDALVMCDDVDTGVGDDVEAPLFAVDGEPMVDRVVRALADSGVEDVYAVVPPAARETAAHVDLPLVEAPADRESTALETALLDHRVEAPVLTVAADLPLLDAAVIDDVLAAHERGALTVAVPTFLKSTLGVSVGDTFVHDGEELAPTGVAVVGDGPDRTVVRDDARLAVRVDSAEDAAVAERLFASRARSDVGD